MNSLSVKLLFLLILLLAYVASSESADCEKLHCWQDCLSKLYSYGVCVNNECQCCGKFIGGK
ncbi:uncharacterized protein LOC100680250 [Nasonia vitripennis]|uniref:Uncharacterized protein n=1 Tax=Nasonia vitripennis TaxID=7425 RepID=A0A7M7LRF3_NASVI|nr:uncharacterized protein LOC100680250 [Nasonia vitripennis]